MNVSLRTLLGTIVLLLNYTAGPAVGVCADNASPDLSQLPSISDIQYKDACGPIACYYALTTLGIQTSLDETAKSCGWKDGAMTPFDNIAAAISSHPQLRVRPVRLSPSQLESFVSKPGHVAILPVRKRSDEINHAVCIASSGGGTLHCFDYPKLQSQLTPDALRQIWDGEALLIERRSSLFGPVEWFLSASFIIGLVLLAGYISSPGQVAVPGKGK